MALLPSALSISLILTGNICQTSWNSTKSLTTISMLWWVRINRICVLMVIIMMTFVWYPEMHNKNQIFQKSVFLDLLHLESGIYFTFWTFINIFAFVLLTERIFHGVCGGYWLNAHYQPDGIDEQNQLSLFHGKIWPFLNNGSQRVSHNASFWNSQEYSVNDII